MGRDAKPIGRDAGLRCHRCGAALQGRDAYRHDGELLCADCCMERRGTRTRKAHWQYLGSIKTEYLRKPDE